MAKFLEGQIKSLTGAVVAEEVPRSQRKPQARRKTGSSSRNVRPRNGPSKPGVLENQAALLASEHTHRSAGRPSPLGRAARVEDLKAVLLLVQGEVAMTEDDGVRLWEPAAEPCQPSPRRTGVVRHHEGSPAELELEGRRQQALERRLIDVTLDGMNGWAERLELLEHRESDEVAGVDHGVGFADDLHASLRQPASSLGHVGVGDDGDQVEAGCR
jgi:hypothetical protein